MMKRLNAQGREKSFNQTLLAYIDLCVNFGFNYLLIFIFLINITVTGKLWFS